MGDENRGIIPSLLKLVYEDLKGFDNGAIYTQKLEFSINSGKKSESVSTGLQGNPSLFTHREKPKIETKITEVEEAVAENPNESSGKMQEENIDPSSLPTPKNDSQESGNTKEDEGKAQASNLEAKNYDNFPDFFTELMKDISHDLYKRHIKVEFKLTIGSKLDPAYTKKKRLVFLVLSKVYEYEMEERRAMFYLIQTGQYNTEEGITLSEEFADLAKERTSSNAYSLVVEVPHLIKVSQWAPFQFQRIKKIMDLVAFVTKEKKFFSHSGSRDWDAAGNNNKGQFSRPGGGFGFGAKSSQK